MKKQQRPFNQYLTHDIEDNDGWQQIEESVSRIGIIVVYFNGLEKSLDAMLCEMFSDRSDAIGLIVLQNMPYSAKVNLFARFSDELHRDIGIVPAEYNKLTDKLREAAKQRNIAIHADWEATNDAGFTFTSIKFSDEGIQQEYVDLSPDAMEAILGTVLSARVQLGKYQDAKQELLRQ